MIEEIKKYDSTFDEELFKTKVNNIFMKLIFSVMDRDISSIEHYINNDVKIQYEKIINNLKEEKLLKVYEEPNISETKIVSYSIDNNCLNIKVSLSFLHICYLVSEDGNQIVSLKPDVRTIRVYDIVLTKRLDAKPIKINTQCPNCGNSLNLSYSGKCEYCKQIIYQDKYDYVITSIK